MPDHVIAGYVGPGQGAGPLFVTLRAGLFASEGLDVDIQLFRGSKRLTEALLAGEALFGNMAAPGVLPALLGGADLVFVTSGINQQFVLGRPGASSLADVAAGTIAVGRPGELPDMFARLLVAHMERRGLQPLRIEYGLEGDDVELLLDGRIDAAIGTPPGANAAHKRGLRSIFDFSEIGLNYTLGGLVTRRQTIAREPKLVGRFVRAYVAGLHRYKTDRDLAVSIQQEYSHVADRDVAYACYDTTEPGMPRIPYPVTSGLQLLLDALSAVDERAREANPASFVDSTIVADLDRSGFIDGLYA